MIKPLPFLFNKVESVIATERGLKMNCAECTKEYQCEKGRNCAPIHLERSLKAYNGSEYGEVLQAAAIMEAEHYLHLTRVEEIIMFAQQMKYQRLGIAFCLGLLEEARIFAKVLKLKGFEINSVCCKICGIGKEDIPLPKIEEGSYETACNPVGQAAILNNNGSELNIVLGLCVGHDAIFTKESKALVTTLAAKDRVLAHNPLGALYSNYHLRKRLGLKEG